MTGHHVQHCDDATAARLEAEGWTIERNALAATHHGAYRPHIAWRCDRSGVDAPVYRRWSAMWPISKIVADLAAQADPVDIANAVRALIAGVEDLQAPPRQGRPS